LRQPRVLAQRPVLCSRENNALRGARLMARHTRRILDSSDLTDAGKRPATTTAEVIMKICTYVNAHHEDFGVALFVLPVTFLGLAIAGLAYAISLLLG
jgi:hypothetical protein